MKILLIGHRGVGKTSLLQRMQIYLRQLEQSKIQVLDLDREIERVHGQSILQLFSSGRESDFRKLEVERFNELIQNTQIILSLGAGFPLDQVKIPRGTEVIWVRRVTDSLGRVFLDRPRLNPKVSPLQEFSERKNLREELFAKFCTQVYEVPEGLTSASEIEKRIFFPDPLNLDMNGGGVWTLQTGAQNCPVEVDFFELREDLPFAGPRPTDPQKLIYSFRNSVRDPLFLAEAQMAMSKGAWLDWPVELGPAKIPFQILSLHERGPGETLQQAAQRLENSTDLLPQHLKFAPRVDNFLELRQGIDWQAQDPQRRSFLPRWRWVRLWLRSRQKINFIGSGLGEVQDQPSLYQWMSTPESIPGFSNFAALLGSPVMHSYTPLEHFSYFQSLQAAVYAVHVDEGEWDEALPLLQQMGLRWAAVTSPLKLKAAELTQSLIPVNTLYWNGQKWLSINTDEDGFRALLESSPDLGQVAVWGGGGTLETLKSSLPGARFFAVRTGQERTPSELPIEPDTVVWAASPSAPPPDLSGWGWRPQVVIDLNYRDDSRAKEYCQRIEARYISGLYMFRVQAQGQRNFWERQYGSQ